jgi:hypothetical protein
MLPAALAALWLLGAAVGLLDDDRRYWEAPYGPHGSRD